MFCSIALFCLSGWERPKLFLRDARKNTISSEGSDNAKIYLQVFAPLPTSAIRHAVSHNSHSSLVRQVSHKGRGNMYHSERFVFLLISMTGVHFVVDYCSFLVRLKLTCNQLISQNHACADYCHNFA